MLGSIAIRFNTSLHLEFELAEILTEKTLLLDAPQHEKYLPSQSLDFFVVDGLVVGSCVLLFVPLHMQIGLDSVPGVVIFKHRSVHLLLEVYFVVILVLLDNFFGLHNFLFALLPASLEPHGLPVLSDDVERHCAMILVMRVIFICHELKATQTDGSYLIFEPNYKSHVKPI